MPCPRLGLDLVADSGYSAREKESYGSSAAYGPCASRAAAASCSAGRTSGWRAAQYAGHCIANSSAESADECAGNSAGRQPAAACKPATTHGISTTEAESERSRSCKPEREPRSGDVQTHKPAWRHLYSDSSDAPRWNE